MHVSVRSPFLRHTFAAPAEFGNLCKYTCKYLHLVKLAPVSRYTDILICMYVCTCMRKPLDRGRLLRRNCVCFKLRAFRLPVVTCITRGVEHSVTQLFSLSPSFVSRRVGLPPSVLGWGHQQERHAWFHPGMASRFSFCLLLLVSPSLCRVLAVGLCVYLSAIYLALPTYLSIYLPLSAWSVSAVRSVSFDHDDSVSLQRVYLRHSGWRDG